MGQPPTYTPPPPGIDDLYRTDLVTALAQLEAGVRTLVGAGASPEIEAELTRLHAALPVQRQALLTGAEAEQEQERALDTTPGQTPAPTPGAPADLTDLVTQLAGVRDLGAQAARQVSGLLARPVCAISVYAAWAATRLVTAAGTGAVPTPPAADEIVPTREVPPQDPPSIAARVDYDGALERTQTDEWYTGYLLEVLAAQSEGDERKSLMTRSEAHRTLATELRTIATDDGGPVVVREAVYALPEGALDPTGRDRVIGATLSTLLVDHIALAGFAPFERRPLPIAAALTLAAQLAPLTDALSAMPSMEPDPNDLSDD